MSSQIPFYNDLTISAAFVGARAQRLADLIGQQGDEFFKSAGISIPARSTSTILYLSHNGPSSLVQIAQALGEPHQLTAKRTSLLETLSMLSIKADPSDKRRRIMTLTRKGKHEVAKIETRCADAVEVFNNLNRELDLQLAQALDAAHAALERQTMLMRTQITKHDSKRSRA